MERGGGGGQGEGERGGGWMETPVFVQKYGHMTQVFSYSGKQRAVKRNGNEISLRLEG